MVRKKKSSKKSIFVKKINSLKDSVNYGKSSDEKLPYSSREEFVEMLFNAIMKKKDTRILRENL
ncbi:MAG: hypothetical protein ACFFDO_01055 [Candidatus Thorarchaeota archaeon]